MFFFSYLCSTYNLNSDLFLRNCNKKTNLNVVGKISGAYKKTVPNEPVIPNLPIMLKPMINHQSFTPPAVIENIHFVFLQLKIVNL